MIVQEQINIPGFHVAIYASAGHVASDVKTPPTSTIGPIPLVTWGPRLDLKTNDKTSVDLHAILRALKKVEAQADAYKHEDSESKRQVMKRSIKACRNAIERVANA